MIYFLDWDPRLSAWGLSDCDLLTQRDELVALVDVLSDDQSLMGTWTRMRLWHWAYMDLKLRGVEQEIRHRGGWATHGNFIFPHWLERGRWVNPPLEVREAGGFIESHRAGYAGVGVYTRRVPHGWKEGWHWRYDGVDVGKFSSEEILANPRAIRSLLLGKKWYCSCYPHCSGRAVHEVLGG